MEKFFKAQQREGEGWKKRLGRKNLENLIAGVRWIKFYLIC